MQLGADPDQLDELAKRLKREARQIESASAVITRSLSTTRWEGPDADEFRRAWASKHRPAASSCREALESMAADLTRNAAEQRRASEAGGGGPGGPAGQDGVVGALESLDAILDRLGIPADLWDGLKGLLRGIDPDLLKDLGRFLAQNPELLKALKVVDGAIGVGSVAVDFLLDWFENPGLPWDEQALHAIVVAGIKYAASDGVGHLVELAIPVVAGMLSGGAAAAPAWLVSKVVGQVVGAASGYVFDAVDGRTNISDQFADVVVDAWREAKEAARVVGAVVGEIGDFADDAVEGVTDFADDVFDKAWGLVPWI